MYALFMSVEKKLIPIKRACTLSGGQAKLARAISVTPQVVHNWIKRAQIPADKVLDIERVTNGSVTRYELRPDIFGSPPGDAA